MYEIYSIFYYFEEKNFISIYCYKKEAESSQYINNIFDIYKK